VAVPLQAANQFYQPLFSSSPLAVRLQQFFSLQQSFSNSLFPFSNPPFSNSFFPFSNLSPALSLQPTPPSKSPTSLFSESFISSGKQGGGATVLREGHDIVSGETCVPTSFSEHKQLRKSSCAAFWLLSLFCDWGCAKSQPIDYLT
jgi:hypothetical protein